VEVLSALAQRRESNELLDLVDSLVSGPRFHPFPLEAPLLERALRVARSAQLRSSDAIYAALALEQNAALLTLDADVCRKLNAVFPELQLITPAEA
jgi:predicted nucleic acid-binding protein